MTDVDFAGTLALKQLEKDKHALKCNLKLDHIGFSYQDDALSAVCCTLKVMSG